MAATPHSCPNEEGNGNTNPQPNSHLEGCCALIWFDKNALFFFFVCLSCCVLYKVKHQKMKHNNHLRKVWQKGVPSYNGQLTCCHGVQNSEEIERTAANWCIRPPASVTYSFQNINQTHHCLQRQALPVLSWHLYTHAAHLQEVWKCGKVLFFFFSLSVFYYVYVILHPNVSMETSAPHLHADAIRQRRLCLGEKGRRWLAAASRRKTAMCPFPGHSLTHMCTNACVFHKNH